MCSIEFSIVRITFKKYLNYMQLPFFELHNVYTNENTILKALPIFPVKTGSFMHAIFAFCMPLQLAVTFLNLHRVLRILIAQFLRCTHSCIKCCTKRKSILVAYFITHQVMIVSFYRNKNGAVEAENDYSSRDVDGSPVLSSRHCFGR